MTPRKLVSKYKWGFNWGNPLPYSYIFAKAKKLYTTARPVISFCNSPFSKIFHALSICLFAITRLAYPGNLHMDDVHETFRKLHKFLQSKSHSKEWTFHNDDLIGFYTSVPQERIMKAIKHLLSTYLAVHPPSKTKITFTVDLLQTRSNQRVFRGTKKRKPATPYQLMPSSCSPRRSAASRRSRLRRFGGVSPTRLQLEFIFSSVQMAPLGADASRREAAPFPSL